VRPSGIAQTLAVELRLVVKLRHPRRGLLRHSLMPAGTNSVLLPARN
jgi:hypothetical protein